MGFNTVAVLLNDRTHEMPDEMQSAVRHAAHPRDRLQLDFRYGRVVSQAHADDSQVVIVGRNSGELARTAKDVDLWALEQMKTCLERHGFKVTKARVSDIHPEGEDAERLSGEAMMARPATAGDAQTFIPCPMPDDVCADCGYRCGVDTMRLAASSLSSYKQRISEMEKALEESYRQIRQLTQDACEIMRDQGYKVDPAHKTYGPIIDRIEAIANRSLISKGETTGVPGFAGRAGGADAPEPHTRLGSDERSSLTQWQPIETAPKDGTKILVYRRMPPWDVIGAAHWVDVAGISGWIARGIYDPPGELGLGDPTHWMPLPPPPSLTQGDEA